MPANNSFKRSGISLHFIRKIEGLRRYFSPRQFAH
jgi:hypothetical protein